MATAGAQAPGSPAPSAEADPIAAVIAAAEANYSRAYRLYEEGQLDEARRQFDATLDQLLQAPYPIADTPRLQTELESVLDRVHSLESDTLQTGGLSVTQTQVSSVERIPELTFPVDAAMRTAIARSASTTDAVALPLPVNDVVVRYVHFLSTSDRQELSDDFRRAGRYRPMVEKIFQAQGVPQDLIYLAQLESDFDPRLVSRAGARGMWQFMASRADDYGLKRTHWVDERQDPEKATLAAARHLHDLHAEFGDWYLAMAAYEAGPETIQRIVARTGYADYWTLYAMNALPKYVRNYVPIILATAIIAHDPAQYGLEDVAPDPPIQSDTLTLQNDLDLRLAAACARVTVSDLQQLNPSLLHYLAPAGFELHLPQGAGDEFSMALQRIPASDQVSWRLHWTEAGDTWSQLSRRFGVSVTRLAAVNHLPLTEPPPQGIPLALPTPPAGGPTRSAGKKSAGQPPV